MKYLRIFTCGFLLIFFLLLSLPVYGASGVDSGEELQQGERGLRGAQNIFWIFGRSADFPEVVPLPEVVIGRYIQGALVIIGTIFGILVVYGGYLWMVARGNEEYVKKAKHTLEAAAIGIVLVMGAYAITAFIVSRVITAAEFGNTSSPPPPSSP